ncbi:hypothetical protein [Melissospora conviva]|jgi:hypothetical protein|uniref:hypothetical protein n=1 Tax=Melissospora conviva TaxID=3388432 RepID=UPI003C1CFDB1
MGTNYQTVLLAAEYPAVERAVAELRAEVLVAPVGAQRWAVIPRDRGDDASRAEVLGRQLSWRARCPALAFQVDSEVMLAQVFRNGRQNHEYVSDVAKLVEWSQDADGQFVRRIDGVVIAPEAPTPAGPSGADPEPFVPFGAGLVDPELLAGVLRGPAPHGSAPEQHVAILRALHLEPYPLTRGFHDPGLNQVPGVRYLTGQPG